MGDLEEVNPWNFFLWLQYSKGNNATDFRINTAA